MNTKSMFKSRILVLVFVLITIYPIMFILLTSFKTTSEFYTNIFGLPKTWRFSNYLEAWTTAHIGDYFINTLITTLITTVAVLFTAALAGYALGRLDVPYSKTILLIMLGITMLPSESVIMPMYLTMSKLKLLNGLYTLIIPYVGWWLPTSVFIFKNFFETLPNELLEAARVDGCSEFKLFYKIVIPLMMPAVGTCAITCFAGIWGELLWATVSLSASSIRTLSMGIVAFQGQFGTNWGLLSAAVSIVLIPIVLLFIYFQKYFVQGISAGAVKG